MPDDAATWTLDEAYDRYPRIEDEFNAALDASLDPRGPDMLFDLVAAMGLPAGATVVDAGCGEGGYSRRLAREFGFRVTGVDPVARHIELARAGEGGGPVTDGTARGEPATDGAAGGPDSGGLDNGGPGGVGSAVFATGTAEELPVPDASVDLVWCRDVLVHVADLTAAYREFRRVLRPGGRVLVYQMVGTDLLEPREAAHLWRAMGVVPASADPAAIDAAIAASGLRLDELLVIGSEWGEFAQERRGHPARKLLHAARLLRSRDEFEARYGAAACDIMMGDCLWHVYGMIGKLERRAYLLTAG